MCHCNFLRKNIILKRRKENGNTRTSVTIPQKLPSNTGRALDPGSAFRLWTTVQRSPPYPDTVEHPGDVLTTVNPNINFQRKQVQTPEAHVRPAKPLCGLGRDLGPRVPSLSLPTALTQAPSLGLPGPNRPLA